MAKTIAKKPAKKAAKKVVKKAAKKAPAKKAPAKKAPAKKPNPVSAPTPMVQAPGPASEPSGDGGSGSTSAF